jgi:hypothetical protein
VERCRDRIGKTRDLIFFALLNIVSACKNLESLSTNAVEGVLEVKWAFSIAKLPKHQHLAVDFGDCDYTEVGTMSLLGRSRARRIIIRELYGLSENRAISKTLPITPVPHSQDSTLCRPYERRAIVFKDCCDWQKFDHELDVMFAHLSEGQDGRLSSVHLLDSRPEGLEYSGSIDLISLLKRYGSGVKELTVDLQWELMGGLSGLASACPHLEKLEVDWTGLDKEDEDVFPESLKMMTIRDCDQWSMEIPIVSSRAGGEVKRVARMPSNPPFCHQTCLASLKVSIPDRRFTFMSSLIVSLPPTCAVSPSLPFLIRRTATKSARSLTSYGSDGKKRGRTKGGRVNARLRLT